MSSKFTEYDGHSDPALEGTTVSFSCPPELELIGPNASMCMRNGVWDPDPREATCKGTMHLPYVSLLFSRLSSNLCMGYSFINGSVAA